MKRTFILFISAIILSAANLLNASAQLVISADLFESVSYKIEAQVLDSLNNEPVPFASVYLMPKKDSMITNFSLSDISGNVVLNEVTRGDYNLHVECLGYEPYIKDMYIQADRNLGTIRLQTDVKSIDAATISSVGKAMEFKQDTIIYNASSFHSLAGDNLSDLLKKMPGIEVGEDGNVKVNGKSVSKISVNGKTFFMGDNKAALDNIPATFVNKVKVTEKDNDKAEFTGIKTGDKETEMDVELKDEYKKGFFGNLKLGSGTSVKGKNDNEFVADRPFLMDASTMISAYGEKNQLTTIANARNVVSDDAVVFMVSSGTAEDNLNLGNDGIGSSWSAGTNLNTEVIKGMDSNVSLMFIHDSVEKKSRSDRTSFMEKGEELLDEQESEGAGSTDQLTLKLEVENKNTDKYTLEFAPRIYYKRFNESSNTNSRSSIDHEEKNRSESFNSSSLEQYFAGGYLDLGVTDLAKEGRTVYLYSDFMAHNTFGNSRDISSLWYAGNNSPTKKNILYDKNNSYYNIYSTLDYIEPLAENWDLNATFSLDYSLRKNYSDAFNADGSGNDYYSSIIDNHYTSLEGNILAQYSKDLFSIYFGTSLQFIENRNYARSYGLDTETGKNDWQKNISPYLRLQWTKNKISYSIRANSYSSQPSPANIIPNLSIINPTRLTIGNIYLKPSFENTFMVDARGSAGDLMFSLYSYGTFTKNAMVSAVWFDRNSIRHSIPVNSGKPQYSIDFNGDISIPLNREKTLSIRYAPYYGIIRSVSYQSGGVMEGIDIDRFEYSKFMDSFYGDGTGNRFYSGESGFRESVSTQTVFNNNLHINLNFERFNMLINLSASNRKSKFSLDPKANVNSWNNAIYLRPQYTTVSDVSMSMTASYNILRGYGSGYDRNYLNMGLKVQKSFKAFSLALIAQDIFNGAGNSLRYTIGDNYVQNSYNLVMGRRVLLRFTWNFGKMSAAKAGSAQNASMNLML